MLPLLEIRIIILSQEWMADVTELRTKDTNPNLFL